MESLGITLFVIFFVYLVLGMPLAICLGLSVITTFWYHDALPLMAVAQKLYNGLDHFALMAIPFFILASNIMSSGGVSKRLIEVCNAFVGHYSGGLAVASIISCMFFAAISGSSPSTVVAIGTIMIPAMIASGYGAKYSVGLLGSAGSLGILIPPSIPMIVYGVATEQSVGKLFMAGVGPGLFMGTLFIITAVVYARIKGFKGGEPAPWKERFVLLWRALPGLFMPFLILGGIYGGIFTPTEAAAVAVFYSLAVGLFVYKDLKFRDIPRVFVRSAVMMAMILFIITNAMLFAFILTTEGIPKAIAAFIIENAVTPWVFLLFVNILLYFVGDFMEPSAAILILAPLFLPIVLQLNIDPIHFGIIMTVNMEIGMITPPVGLNLFVASGISGLSLWDVFKGAAPFMVIMLVALFIITYIPIISLWFPKLLYGALF
ncbi:MAG: TRAP transporter large permease [Desulfobacteraceae bacterium]|nr:TRAP transporter large permease [Desulfobacteraceae bacterium]